MGLHVRSPLFGLSLSFEGLEPALVASDFMVERD